jgi:MbtH protein
MLDVNYIDDLTIDGDRFQVLINAEGQFSLWPAGQAAPGGWTPIGRVGSKGDCLAYVDSNWLDLRPKTSRRRMANADFGR